MLLAVEYEQTLGHCIQCFPDPSGNRLGRIELAQHFGEIAVKNNKPRQSHEPDHLNYRHLQQTPDAPAFQWFKTKLQLSPFLIAGPDGAHDL